MKTIGVLSDTHLTTPDPDWVRQVTRAFSGVDLVLHAGDLTDLRVLDALSEFSVLAVSGNMDDHLVVQSLPTKRVIELEGFRIGLIHGWGAPQGIEDRIRNEFEQVHCIVFGHSHRPTNHVEDGILFFNPGSAGRAWRSSGTVGIITVDKEITGRIIEL